MSKLFVSIKYKGTRLILVSIFVFFVFVACIIDAIMKFLTPGIFEEATNGDKITIYGWIAFAEECVLQCIESIDGKYNELNEWYENINT
jgi:hypothetical protein